MDSATDRLIQWMGETFKYANRFPEFASIIIEKFPCCESPFHLDSLQNSKLKVRIYSRWTHFFLPSHGDGRV